MEYKIKRRQVVEGELVKVPKGSIGVTVTYECAGRYDYRVIWLEPIDKHKRIK